MNARLAAATLLIATLAFGWVFSSKAYAHNFGGGESAAYLAKVREVPVETHAIQSDLGKPDVLAWHFDKIGEYWDANDTKEMSERNKLLATNIPGDIAKLIQEANKTNPDPANVTQLVNALDGYMTESVPVRIDSPQLNNLTVSAQAINDVLGEVMEGYGHATNSSESSAVHTAAYQNAKGLADAASAMWTELKAKTPSNVSSTTISTLDGAFANLTKSIAANASDDTINSIANDTIKSNFAIAYKTEVAPEFPLPLSITVASIAGVIVFARLKSNKKRGGSV
jgi:hypothetical protein